MQLYVAQSDSSKPDTPESTPNEQSWPDLGTRERWADLLTRQHGFDPFRSLALRRAFRMASDPNVGYFESQDNASKALNYDRKTVNRAFQRFLKLGLFREIRPPYGGGRSKAYVPNFPVDVYLPGTAAAFVVTEESLHPSWPGHKDPIGEGNPVYIAEPDSFQPDIVRGAASPEDFEMLKEFARQHEEATGIKPAAAAFGFVPQSPRGTPTATTISTGSTDPREIPLPRRFSPNLAKPHPQHHPRALPDPRKPAPGVNPRTDPQPPNHTGPPLQPHRPIHA